MNDDYSGIVFTRDSDDSDYLLLSLADGSVKEIDKLNIERDTSGLIRNDHDVIIGMKYAGFTPDYKLLDDKLNQKFKSIVAQFPNQSVHLVDWTPDWKHIVFKVEVVNMLETICCLEKAKTLLKLAALGQKLNVIKLTQFSRINIHLEMGSQSRRY